MVKYSVKLKTIAEKQKLTPVRLSSNYEDTLITTADINRPAMQLTGFYNYFDPKRVQLIGMVETTYLDTLSEEERRAAFEKLLQYDIPAIIFCHECKAFPECIEAAEKFDRNVLLRRKTHQPFRRISSLSSENISARELQGMAFLLKYTAKAF